MRSLGLFAGVFLSVSAPNLALGKVDSATSASFVVNCTVVTSADTELCWRNLLAVDTWWSPEHTWSGNSENLSMTPVAGGGFDEKLPDGGFVRHMDVIYADPGKLMRLRGVLGPLQEHALTGTMTIAFKRDGDRTEITATYRVSGEFPGGLEVIAPAVDQVLAEQFQNLKKVIDAAHDGAK